MILEGLPGRNFERSFDESLEYNVKNPLEKDTLENFWRFFFCEISKGVLSFWDNSPKESQELFLNKSIEQLLKKLMELWSKLGSNHWFYTIIPGELSGIIHEFCDGFSDKVSGIFFEEILTEISQ